MGNASRLKKTNSAPTNGLQRHAAERSKWRWSHNNPDRVIAKATG